MGPRDRAVGAVLAQVVALSRLIAAEQRAPFEGVELSANQLALLFLLARNPDGVTPGAAASALGVTPGAVTQLVDGMRLADLVASAPHPADGRSRLLLLTTTASAHVRAYESDVVRRLLPAFGSLDDAEVRTLADLLERVEARP